MRSSGGKQLKNGKSFVQPNDRSAALAKCRNLKMARSSHAYVRGNTVKYYEWLASLKSGTLPNGPPVWICGDCHICNLGPVANSAEHVEIQIRDLDQTVIGNPAHDLIRLGLSLASAARGSDLPGITTAKMLEKILLLRRRCGVISATAGPLSPSFRRRRHDCRCAANRIRGMRAGVTQGKSERESDRPNHDDRLDSLPPFRRA
jgi:Uncharacterized protein conserved in bacteria (DUF2252)